jgi:hypothetical protein
VRGARLYGERGGNRRQRQERIEYGAHGGGCVLSATGWASRVREWMWNAVAAVLRSKAGQT